MAIRWETTHLRTKSPIKVQQSPLLVQPKNVLKREDSLEAQRLVGDRRCGGGWRRRLNLRGFLRLFVERHGSLVVSILILSIPAHPIRPTRLSSSMHPGSSPRLQDFR